MKTNILTKPAVQACLAAVMMAGAVSCESIFTPSGECEMRISFYEDWTLQTRAGVTDTNSFILRVTDSKGRSVYEGEYGAAPSSMMVSPGTYDVRVSSADFRAPAFSSPVYGDAQSVTIRSGEVTTVVMMCRQINAGIRMNISSDFLSAYPNGSLFLKSDDGKLLYSYSEKRTAYFNPGQVSLILSDGGTDQTLLSRSVASQEIYTLNISVAAKQQAAGMTAGGIRIELDTCRVWTSEDYVIGGSANKGSSKDAPFSVNEARSMAGTGDVWVYGYVVGGDLSSSKASFSGPFTSRTNIVLAAKSSVRDRSECMSVQLTSGDIRNALNLVDNPSVLGRAVCIRGNIVPAYYGLPGIQGLTDYEIR